MEKVDVIIATYGKPWNLLVTLESLMVNSEQHIDKIFLLEEAKHPYGDNIEEVLKYDYPIVHYKYKKWYDIYHTPSNLIPKENVRHEYGIEKSDKKHVFISHNDVLYTGDVIGGMLEEIGDCIGIGELSSCWNCPAQKLCGGGQNWNKWNPTYEEVISLPMPHIRTRKEDIDKEYPKLLPECRLNEWSCLINREVCVKEGKPYFGDFGKPDSGNEWFRSMVKKGYKFKDYRNHFEHGYFTPDRSGYNAEQVETRYRKSEELAKQYFKEHYEIN